MSDVNILGNRKNNNFSVKLLDTMMDIEKPHRRLNLLTGDWVLVSPHRAQRPWLGQVEKTSAEVLPTYDPECYLCPGNLRTSGIRNADYQSTFVFDNDFPALLKPAESSPGGFNQDGLLVAESEAGICRVVCFSPRHDLTLPELSQKEVEQVVATWREQAIVLGKNPHIAYVQIFENKGAIMGCSNPHPHSQIWATNKLSNQAFIESQQQENFFQKEGKCLLCRYLDLETSLGVRLVVSNDHFTALTPFWAVWPFETLILSHRHFGNFDQLSSAEISALADILRQITIRYDNLFEISFPYSMGFHGSPCDGGRYPGWHFHAHFYPPLLRSATVRKFMVGFEMLGMPQRDLTPELAAERLRSLSDSHYKDRV